MSTVKLTDPGMTLTTPGHTDRLPTVHTVLSSTPTVPMDARQQHTHPSSSCAPPQRNTRTLSLALADALDGMYHLRRSCHGVPPQLHRHSARVPLLSSNLHHQPRLPDNGPHNPQWAIEGLEHWPLLDVQLYVARHLQVGVDCVACVACVDCHGAWRYPL